MAKGNCERIGIDGRYKHSTSDGRKLAGNETFPNHRMALHKIIDMLTVGDGAVIDNIGEIAAVGHRAVHGGEEFSESVLVTDKVLEDFASFSEFAPLHNPPAVTVVKACRERLGEKVPNVLVFDTAFHQTMPPRAFLFAVPYKYYEKYKLRRYGFHGTSHRYVSLRCAELMGKKPEELKIVTCHLGNGGSLAAVDGGKCIDTSMGFTPLGGIIMGTRSGDLDPSVVTFIMEKEGYTPQQMESVLNKQSGFIGLSGISSDDRDLEVATAKGIRRSIISQDAQRYQIKKYVGAYTAAMGGLDALVFTGGIGENSCLLRAAVCDNMEYLGIQIDHRKNDETVHGKEGDISNKESKARVFVIPTNEEYAIAMDTKKIVESM